MKKFLTATLVLGILIAVLAPSLPAIAEEEFERPAQTGTMLDLPGADPDTFRQVDDANKKSFDLLNRLLDYSKERFWAVWEGAIEFLKDLQPWYTEQQLTVNTL